MDAWFIRTDIQIISPASSLRPPHLELFLSLQSLTSSLFKLLINLIRPQIRAITAISLLPGLRSE